MDIIFWYEDIEAVRCDYNTLKSFLEELCNVTRIEKFTNILNNIVNSVKAGMISEDFIKSEINYIYNLEKNLKGFEPQFKFTLSPNIHS